MQRETPGRARSRWSNSISEVRPFTIVDVDNASQLQLWSTTSGIINWDEGVGDLLNLVGYSMADNGPLAYSGSGGWNGNIFGELEGDDPLQKNDFGGSRASDNRFNLFERGQSNNYEGFYIDDIIVGFAERGELVTDAYRDGTVTTFTAAPEPDPDLYGFYPNPEYPIVTEGSYQLEVRTVRQLRLVNRRRVPTRSRSSPRRWTRTTAWRMISPSSSRRPAKSTTAQWFELSDSRADLTLRFVFVDETVGGGAGYGKHPHRLQCDGYGRRHGPEGRRRHQSGQGGR